MPPSLTIGNSLMVKRSNFSNTVSMNKNRQMKRLSGLGKGKPEYENIFTEWATAYDQWRPYAKHRMYIRRRNTEHKWIQILQFAASLMVLESDMLKKGVDHADVKKSGWKTRISTRKSFVEEINIPSEKNFATDYLQMFYENIDKQQHPIRIL